MTATATPEVYVEEERVLLWRLAGFEALGVADYPQALELALSDADLHKARAMVERGCSPELLRAILL